MRLIQLTRLALAILLTAGAVALGTGIGHAANMHAAVSSLKLLGPGNPGPPAE